MFAEDDKEVKEIIERVIYYFQRMMLDEFTQSVKEQSEAFKQLKENGFKKTLIAIPLEESEWN